MAPQTGPLCLGSSPNKPQVSPSPSIHSSDSSLCFQPSPTLLNSPSSCTHMQAHIPRHSWQRQPKHIHTSHCSSTLGSLYDWRYRDTHIHTQAELLGETASQSLLLLGPPLAHSKGKKAISMWKIALVTNVHK